MQCYQYSLLNSHYYPLEHNHHIHRQMNFHHTLQHNLLYCHSNHKNLHQFHCRRIHHTHQSQQYSFHRNQNFVQDIRMSHCLCLPQGYSYMQLDLYSHISLQLFREQKRPYRDHQIDRLHQRLD